MDFDSTVNIKNLSNKIFLWLSNVSIKTKIIQETEDRLWQQCSNMAVEESLQLTGLSTELQKIVNKCECQLAKVEWSLNDCDVLLKVDQILFPVQKQIITSTSQYFQEMLSNSTEQLFTLDGYDEEELRSVLLSIYFPNMQLISNENVASLVQLGEKFGLKQLRAKCELYLKNSPTFNPFITLHLAKQYQLDALLEHSMKEISKIEDVENTAEFNCLNIRTQNLILRYVLHRFQKASEIFSQFDVHLCNHHGDNAKNNKCCFRAATYETKNNRTFLVKIEEPQAKLKVTYENAFRVE